jgi:predicted RNA binding protein YcfA (HicA-like mRNA interferase family)
MGKKEKLLEKARNNPKGLSFKEFENLLVSSGWIMDRQSGSHKIYYSQNGIRLPIQNRHGKAKEYQVKQFIKIIEGGENA